MILNHYPPVIKQIKDIQQIAKAEDGMQFVLAETMEDVLQTALVKGEKDA